MLCINFGIKNYRGTSNSRSGKQGTLNEDDDKGSQVGEVFISHASHLYNPRLIHGLCTLAEICSSQSNSECFSLHTPVFLLCKFDFHAKI